MRPNTPPRTSPGHPSQQPAASRGSRRSADDLFAEFRGRGQVVAETVRPGALGATMILGGLALAAGLLTVLLGVLAAARGDASLGMAVVGVLLVTLCLGAAALWSWRRSATARGRTWVIGTEGITIDGVGPVPWGDLEPPTERMEDAPRDEGRQLALVMPFTPAGQVRADQLDPSLRGVLNDAARPRAFGTPRVHSVRIVRMKGTDRHEFARFLERAHRAVLGR